MAYFDWNATAPLSSAAREAWLEMAEEGWSNPSAVYRAGAGARVLLDETRSKLAELLGAGGSSIIFTSGASESCNAFMRISAKKESMGRNVWISSVEHPAVREPAFHYWGKERVTQIPVTSEGRVDLDWMETNLQKEQPALICVMAVNNETGVIQPLDQVNGLCLSHGIPLFSDAVQWIGKIAEPFNPGSALVGYSISGHKFGGPKGVGCLLLAEGWNDSALQYGGGQESGLRAGTEDLAGIAGMVAALEERMAHKTENADRIRDQFEDRLVELFPEVLIHGKRAPRIWNTSCVSMPRFRSHRWIARLDRLGFQLSTGAACSAGKKGPSMVMQAMGVDDEAARRTLRISSGWNTSSADWDGLVEAMRTVYEQLSDENRGDGPGQVIKL